MGVFYHVQLSRHSEATAALIPEGSATAQGGSRLWHHLYDTASARMKKARVKGVMETSDISKEDLRGQAKCNRIGMPVGCPL